MYKSHGPCKGLWEIPFGVIHTSLSSTKSNRIHSSLFMFLVTRKVPMLWESLHTTWEANTSQYHVPVLCNGLTVYLTSM